MLSVCSFSFSQLPFFPFLSHSHWLLITNSFPMLCLLFLKHTLTHIIHTHLGVCAARPRSRLTRAGSESGQRYLFACLALFPSVMDSWLSASQQFHVREARRGSTVPTSSCSPSSSLQLSLKERNDNILHVSHRPKNI